MMKTAAIIGISNYGRHHLLMAMEQVMQGKLKLLAATIVNLREESFFAARLESLGCEIFSSPDLMWAKFSGQIDLCFIPTGIHLHAAMTIQALQAGSHVFVEKPLAATITQADQIILAEHMTGRTVSVGFQDLYTDSTWNIKHLLLAGYLGAVKNFTLIGLWPRPPSYYQRNNWAGRLHQDGRAVMDSPVNNAFAHFINLGLFWAGSTPAESASTSSLECERYRVHKIESFDTICARVRFSTGSQFCFYLTHVSTETRTPRLIINGTRGSLTWVQESHYTIARPGRPDEHHLVPRKFETKFMMADALLDRISGRASHVCTTTIARAHTQLIDALHLTGKIHPISDSHLSHPENKIDGYIRLQGVEAACDTAETRHCLWSEMDVPWSQKFGARQLTPKE